MNRPLVILILASLLVIPAFASGSPVLSAISPGTPTYDQALAHYDAGGLAWSRAWGASELGAIRENLAQSKGAYTNCLSTANAVNDPANAANLALMRSISTAYIDLADAALAMYDGADDYAAGRASMTAGSFTTAAGSFQSAGTRFETSKTLFSKATTMLQAVTYTGTSFGDGTAYTAAIVPILNAKGTYMGEFASYARGWQHTALAYGASAGGDRATFQSEAVQAMDLFAGLRTSGSFGVDAAANHDVLAELLDGTTPAPAPKARYVIGIDAAYPPYTSLEQDGTFVGFDIDSARWIADRMGFEVEFQAVAWDGIIPALLAKKIDMIYSAMTITEERREQVAFSIPYLKINQAVAVRSDSDLTFDDIMSGRVVIGTQRGTTGEMWVQDNLVATGKMPASNLKPFDNFPLAITALINKQVDATVYDKPPTVEIIGQQDAKIIYEIDTREEYGIAVRKDDTALLATMNAGLDLLMNDPYWDQLKARYGLVGT
ncbi:MAG: basic amino acid ABC transporter substrate-binding protein [Methanospirillum sp.]|nr:basic amino acid ABC transporter substrate-binding protein [Methanospirillum sp.]